MPVIQININNYDLYGKDELVYESMMMEKSHKIVRDKIIKIYDINLEKLINIDYNEIKKGNSYNLSKILYIFICKDKRILDYIYVGDRVMEKVRESFDDYTRVLDEMLYYDPEDLNRQI